MKKHFKNLICLALCAVIAATSCACGYILDEAGGTPSDSDSQTGTAGSTAGDPSGGQTAGNTQTDRHGDFALCCSPNHGFHPYECTDTYNLTVISLMYEGLFALESDLSVRSVLCRSYSTDDGITYTFEIFTDIKMHDGETMTAADVVYSVKEAAKSEKYASRFADIDDVYEDEDGSVVIILTEANYSLPSLLDIPVIRKGSADEDTPTGTGPYVLKNEEDSMSLAAFTEGRYFSSLPVKDIILYPCEPSDLPYAFSANFVSLLPYDYTGTYSPNILSDFEVRHYDTTVLQFIGYNTAEGPFTSARLRRAVGHAVDRAGIVSSVYSGAAVASPFILSPVISPVLSSWEDEAGFSLHTFSQLLSEIDVGDYNADGYLEYPEDDGLYYKFSVDFIVNSENGSRVAAAGIIAEQLRDLGIDVNLRVLMWDEFLAALDAGDFDMYLAETKLTADFDMSNLFEVGGALNFGGIDNSSYASLISAYLGSTGDEKAVAAQNLCVYSYRQADVIPICYKRLSVLSQRGIITSILPSQTGTFSNIPELGINSD